METAGRLPNIHPGEVLGEDFLKPLGLTAARLARDIGIGRARVSEVVRGIRDITPDTAIRLGLYFGTEPEFWLNLQPHYNLVEARLANGDRYRDIPRHVHTDAAA